ncbi:MAG: hypothetical protein PHR77_01470 [Kiritimatiellae bacterium]|nr:hypothetical protein [Kiritimatiellia bacterium]MDD5521745.1 hypothetical protein [Kiritimatiellia bacterium]
MLSIRKHMLLWVPLILFCWSSGHSIFAQDWAKPVIKNLQRVDLRDLGYPLINEIPANSKAITSLLTAKDGKIYGGTSGETAYLFIFDPAINKVRHLGRIKGSEAIHHALVEDKNGFIYIGTGKNMFEEIKLSKGGIGDEFIDVTLWNDIKNHFKAYEGGHLYRYSPKEHNDKVNLADMDCELVDLGVPLANNMIYALTINPDGYEIYGITYPDGHFFIYNIAQKKIRDLGEIDREVVHHGPERYWRSLSRALVCDDSGRVYMSGTKGILQYYCPNSGKIISTGQKIPGDYYHVQFYKDYAVVDYFAKDETGMIYGGSSDGYLFSFNPAQMRLINLGKPRVDRRLRCLTVGKDGKIYMMAGERASSRPCQFYCYDPKVGGYEDLGLLIVDRSPYYYWRGYQFDAMTTGLDGTIFLGESERLGHLYLYLP